MLQNNNGLKAVESCVVECTLVFKQVLSHMNKRIKNRALIPLQTVFVISTWFAILEQISTLTMESKIRFGRMGHGLLLIYKWPHMCVSDASDPTHPNAGTVDSA